MVPTPFPVSVPLPGASVRRWFAHSFVNPLLAPKVNLLCRGPLVASEVRFGELREGGTRVPTLFPSERCF